MKRKGKKKGHNKKIKRKKLPPPPPWTELPGDITANILQRLGAVDVLANAQKVCTTWHSVCKDPSFWRVIVMPRIDDPTNIPYDLDLMCRHAVDRSQGQLIDINIEYFGTSKLLKYIAKRCSQLRRLRIASCYDISAGALSRFPLLEEIQFFFAFVSTKHVDMLGRSCPLLKSFSLTRRFSVDYYMEDNDEVALTIAKSMPGLRHLRLLGNSLTDNGLLAILDGCPHLETLDLRECYGLELSGDLGKRCSQQIKSLRLPYDSTADSGFVGIPFIPPREFSECSDLDLQSDYHDDEDYDDYTRSDYMDYLDSKKSEDIFGF